MMTDPSSYGLLKAHLLDLQQRALTRHKAQASDFLSEDEQSALTAAFPPGPLIKYDGGYPSARKKKVIFLADEEDDFSDVVCLRAKVDQRFRRIGHRDILGALLSLSIDRGCFGDLWIDGDYIYIYTSKNMAGFLIDHLTRVNQMKVSLKILADHPERPARQRRFEVVIASERMDAVVAGISHCSRRRAKELIRAGLVSLNHITLEEPDRLAYNNVTISIRGSGRFTYLGAVRHTRGNRIVAAFMQEI